MDPLRITPSTTPTTIARTGERQGGARRGDADAFRRALQQRQEDSPPTSEQPVARAPVRPVPSALQRQALASRKDQQPTALHVDVIA